LVALHSTLPAISSATGRSYGQLEPVSERA